MCIVKDVYFSIFILYCVALQCKNSMRTVYWLNSIFVCIHCMHTNPVFKTVIRIYVVNMLSSKSYIGQSSTCNSMTSLVTNFLFTVALIRNLSASA